MHTLRVQKRSSGKANVLRKNGLVPGVVYGPSVESTAISIGRKDLLSLFSEITRSSRISLQIDDEERELDVFLKVVEYDSISDEPIHVDFFHPDAGQALKLHVPIRVEGEAIGTKSGGILNVLFDSVRVHGLSEDIPHLITLNVAPLDLGQSIRVRDVDFGNVEPMLPEERTLVTVIAPRGLGTEEGVEGAEGEEAAEGEGEGPAEAGTEPAEAEAAAEE